MSLKREIKENLILIKAELRIRNKKLEGVDILLDPIARKGLWVYIKRYIHGLFK